jgi:hypothetical protein
MTGIYLMEDLVSRKRFEVKIPAFQMEAPFKRN